MLAWPVAPSSWPGTLLPSPRHPWEVAGSRCHLRGGCHSRRVPAEGRRPDGRGVRPQPRPRAWPPPRPGGPLPGAPPTGAARGCEPPHFPAVLLAAVSAPLRRGGLGSAGGDSGPSSAPLNGRHWAEPRRGRKARCTSPHPQPTLPALRGPGLWVPLFRRWRTGCGPRAQAGASGRRQNRAATCVWGGRPGREAGAVAQHLGDWGSGCDSSLFFILKS